MTPSEEEANVKLAVLGALYDIKQKGFSSPNRSGSKIISPADWRDQENTGSHFPTTKEQ